MISRKVVAYMELHGVSMVTDGENKTPNCPLGWFGGTQNTKLKPTAIALD